MCFERYKRMAGKLIPIFKMPLLLKFFLIIGSFFVLNIEANVEVMDNSTLSLISNTIPAITGNDEIMVETEVTQTSMKLNWDCTSDREYSATFLMMSESCYRNSGCLDSGRSEMVRNCQIFIDNLCPSSDYDVTVNEGGADGEPVSSGSIRTLIGNPIPPEGLISRYQTDTTVHLEWETVKCPEEAEFRYTLLSWEAEQNDNDYVYGRISPIQQYGNEFWFPTYEPWTQYAFQVKVCIVGNEKLCANSEIIEAKTEVGRPGKCQYVKAVIKNATLIEVTWKEPIVKNGPIEGFVVFWKKSSDDDYPKENIKELGREINYYGIELLDSSADYVIGITAVNQNSETDLVYGEFVIVPPCSHPTTTTEPSSPLEGVMTSNTDSSVSLTWEAPLTPKCTIDGYQIKYEILQLKDGDLNKEPKEILTWENEYEIKDLKAWRNYTIKIRAYNYNYQNREEMIFGDELTFTAFTQIGIPMKPTNVIIRPIETCRVINWYEAIDATSMVVKWDKPIPVTGPTTYIIKLEIARQINYQCDQNVKWDPMYIDMTDHLDYEETAFEIRSLKPNYCYRVTVIAKTKMGTNKSDPSHIIQMLVKGKSNLTNYI